MFPQKQSYYLCERFGKAECPDRGNPALRNREIVRGNFEKKGNKDYGTLEEYLERKKICRNCEKFVLIEFRK
jgi:hypothetical protein